MVNSFLPYLRLTVKIFQLLRLSTNFLAVLRLSVNPIETLLVDKTYQSVKRGIHESQQKSFSQSFTSRPMIGSNNFSVTFCNLIVSFFLFLFKLSRCLQSHYKIYTHQTSLEQLRMVLLPNREPGIICLAFGIQENLL